MCVCVCLPNAISTMGENKVKMLLMCKRGGDAEPPSLK